MHSRILFTTLLLAGSCGEALETRQAIAPPEAVVTLRGREHVSGAPADLAECGPGRVLLEVREGPFGVPMGDMNGDGCTEVAISNRKLHYDRDRPTTIKVYSGPAGDVILKLEGGPGFGYRIACAGDADADGIPDLLVTTGDVASLPDSIVAVYSGADGSVLCEIAGRDSGMALAGPGDLDADGHDDFAFTMGVRNQVDVVAHSGRTGALLWKVTHTGEGFWASQAALAPSGDVNSDGIPDLAFVGPCGHPQHAGWHKQLKILSGVDGALLFAHDDSEFSPRGEGECVAQLGDINGDGVSDLIVGGSTPGFNMARVVSGADGRAILDVNDQVPNYGWATAGLGDFDGDSIPDFAVGAPPFEDKSHLGRVSVYSGATGGLIRAFTGQVDDDDFMWPGMGYSFGISVRGIGDYNGDGYSDLLIGEARDFNRYPTQADRSVIVAGGPPQLDTQHGGK